MIVVLKACRRELDELSDELKGDLADALARLDAGGCLTMPLSRPMPSIGPQVHELRLRDRAGIYRVVYALRTAHTIYVIHAFKKKTEQTAKRNLDIAKLRLKECKP